MISAFSRLSAFLGLPVRAFSMIAHTAKALATPTNKIVVICAALLAWALKSVVHDGIVRLPELPQIDYGGCCPRTHVVYTGTLRHARLISFRARSRFSPAPFRGWVATILDEHLRYWPRLTVERVCDAMRSVSNHADPCHYVGSSEKDILEHVTLIDDHG